MFIASSPWRCTYCETVHNNICKQKKTAITAIKKLVCELDINKNIEYDNRVIL